MCAEVDAAVRTYLPPCDDWTEVYINSKLIDIVARVSGRVFVGADLAQDPEYLEIGANYTVYLIEAVRAIKQIRPWLRPFLVPRLPEIKRLRDMEKKATKHLEPIVKERVNAQKDPNFQQPDDMVWFARCQARRVLMINRCNGCSIAAQSTASRQSNNLLNNSSD